MDNQKTFKTSIIANGEWVKYLITIMAILAIIIYRVNNIQIQWAEIVLFAIGVIPWFSSFTQSFKLGKDGFEAVFRELEKAKQELKEDVKMEAEKNAEKINELKESNAVTQSITAFGAGGRKSVDSIKDYKTKDLAEALDQTDPQRGKWGGNPLDDKTHRKLSAKVEDIPNDNYFRRVILRVESTDPASFPLNNIVTFHLHPTFAKPEIEVKPIHNVAEINVIAYGAFTVGAVTDGGKTKLEFDIAKLGEGNGDLFFTR
jgi:hypothetical protein